MTTDLETDGTTTTVTMDAEMLQELIKNSRHRVTVDGTYLAQAIAAIVPHAATDGALHRVRIDCGPDHLDLMAVSARSVAIVRIEGFGLEVPDDDQGPWAVDISPDELALVGKLFKPPKDVQITMRLDVLNDGRVAFTDASGLPIDVGRCYTVPSLGDRKRFPDVRNVLLSHMNRAHGIVGCVTYTGDILKRFAASCAAFGMNAVIEPTDRDRPFVVTIGDRFIGLLLPVKSDDFTSSDKSVNRIRNTWRDRLSVLPTFTDAGEPVNTETGEITEPAGDEHGSPGDGADDA